MKEFPAWIKKSIYDVAMKPVVRMIRLKIRRSNDVKRRNHFKFFIRSSSDLIQKCVVCNNCVGSMMQHDLGQPFLSPTVNLYIPTPDYVSFLKILPDLGAKRLVEAPSEFPYPKGILDENIRVYFMHYDTFDEALQKWNERVKRIDISKLVVLYVEREDCTYEYLREFDNLPFNRKYCLVHKKYDDINSQIVVPGFEKKGIGILTDYEGFRGRRKYDRIDWVKFFTE